RVEFWLVSSHASARLPEVSRVASSTSANTTSKLAPAARTSRSVTFVVSAVRLADPPDNPTRLDRAEVVRMTTRVIPPMTANRIIRGLVADDLLGSGSGSGGWVSYGVYWVVMASPVVAAAGWRPGFRCVPGRQEPVGCRFRLLQVQVFGRSR